MIDTPDMPLTIQKPSRYFLKIKIHCFIWVSVIKSLYAKLPNSEDYSCTKIPFNSKYAHTCPPPIAFWINNNLVRKGVCFAGSDRRNVVFLSVDSRDDLHGCFEKHSLHSFANFHSLYPVKIISNYPIDSSAKSSYRSPSAG